MRSVDDLHRDLSEWQPGDAVRVAILRGKAPSTTRSEARSTIFEWLEVSYNRQRVHETLDYVSPVRYEAQSVVS